MLFKQAFQLLASLSRNRRAVHSHRMIGRFQVFILVLALCTSGCHGLALPRSAQQAQNDAKRDFSAGKMSFYSVHETEGDGPEDYNPGLGCIVSSNRRFPGSYGVRAGATSLGCKLDESYMAAYNVKMAMLNSKGYKRQCGANATIQRDGKLVSVAP
jgi:hypothetical protein